MTENLSLYENLKQKILTFEFMPQENLIERTLEARFNVSRTPVRAALQKLESDGLIIKNGRSYCVTPLNSEDMRHAFDLRLLLEMHTVEKAAQCATRDDIDLLKLLANDAKNEKQHQNLAKRFELGLEFHLAIARIAGNPMVFSILKDINAIIYRAIWLQALSEQATNKGHEEHLLLIKAIETHNETEAKTIITQHIEAVRDNLIKVLAQFNTKPNALSLALLKKSA